MFKKIEKKKPGANLDNLLSEIADIDPGQEQIQEDVVPGLNPAGKAIKKKRKGVEAFSKEFNRRDADEVEAHLHLTDKEFMRQAQKEYVDANM